MQCYALFVITMNDFISPNTDSLSRTQADSLSRTLHLKATLRESIKELKQLKSLLRRIERIVKHCTGTKEQFDEIMHANSIQSDQDESDYDSEDDLHLSRNEIPFESTDSEQMTDCITKINKRRDQIVASQREIVELVHRHRRYLHMYQSLASHDPLQRLASNVHKHCNVAVLIGLHRPDHRCRHALYSGVGELSHIQSASYGAESSASGSSGLSNGEMMDIRRLITRLKQAIGDDRHSTLPAAISLLTKCISETFEPVESLTDDRKTTRNTLESLVGQLKTFSHAVNYFEQTEQLFAEGLIQLTGCRMTSLNETDKKERVKSTVVFLLDYVKQVDTFICTGENGDNMSEMSFYPGAMGEEEEDIATEILFADFQEYAAMRKEDTVSVYRMLESRSPIAAASNRVFNDLCIRYPHLGGNDITPLVLMDRYKNGLYAAFQRLVGLDWNLSRRLSGQKVTYASDYNRMSTQYRTTTFAFKHVRITQGDDGTPKLILPGQTLPEMPIC